MGFVAKHNAKRIKRLFNDKVIVDVLGLANKTRYGIEMPEISVFLEDDLYSGYVAIENISNYDSLNKSQINQKISGVLRGKWQKYAVTSSELFQGDTYMLYYFEDCQTSVRLVLNTDNDIRRFISDDRHAIILSNDLVWHADKVPHLSIIARTRAGKSILAGNYLASLMLLQGWTVEYNSAKLDIYVQKYNGKSEPVEIVERAEFWVAKMQKRLKSINEVKAEKYTDMVNMNDIAIFLMRLVI